jgi:hypothetical protein
MKKKYFKLQQGLETMLEFSKDNPDNKEKAKFIAKWVRQYYKEKSVSEMIGFAT